MLAEVVFMIDASFMQVELWAEVAFMIDASSEFQLVFGKWKIPVNALPTHAQTSNLRESAIIIADPHVYIYIYIYIESAIIIADPRICKP